MFNKNFLQQFSSSSEESDPNENLNSMMLIAQNLSRNEGQLDMRGSSFFINSKSSVSSSSFEKFFQMMQAKNNKKPEDFFLNSSSNSSPFNENWNLHFSEFSLHAQLNANNLPNKKNEKNDQLIQLEKNVSPNSFLKNPSKMEITPFCSTASPLVSDINSTFSKNETTKELSLSQQEKEKNETKDNAEPLLEFKTPKDQIGAFLLLKQNEILHGKNSKSKTDYQKFNQSCYNSITPINGLSTSRSAHSLLSGNHTDVTLLNPNIQTPCPTIKTSEISFISAIVEGRCNATREIGLALLDVEGCKLILSQFPDDLAYSCLVSKFNIYQPQIVVIPTMRHGDSEILTQATAKLKITNFIQIERKEFNDMIGKKLIATLMNKGFENIEYDIQKKYYAMSACAGLLTFYSRVFGIKFHPNSLHVQYESMEKSMLIDFKSVKNLELVLNETCAKDTLFAKLNETRTLDGERLLKASLLQPFLNHENIEQRLDCISELMSNSELYKQLHSTLDRLIVKNVKKVVVKLAQITPNDQPLSLQKIICIINLRYILKTVKEFADLLITSENYQFRSWAAHLYDNARERLEHTLDTTIKPNINYENLKVTRNKFLTLNHGLSNTFDYSIEIYNNLLQELETTKEACENQNLRLTYRNGKYFYVGKADPNNQGLILTKKISQQKSLYLTSELIAINTRISAAYEKCVIEMNKILDPVLVLLRKDINYLFRLAEIIPMIDLILALTKCAIVHKWTRPHFGESLTLSDASHPLLSSSYFVKNSINMEKLNNVAIINGANSSGKTTFIKQVALLQIMAQIGCFVPAKVAHFRLIDRIFARVGCNDDFRANCSSFLLELKEVQFILANLTENSLVIIDELGRGTSSDVGVIFCFSVIENLIVSKCFTLMATHFTEMQFLEAIYYTVTNYVMKSSEINDNNVLKIKNHFLLQRGNHCLKGYGIKFANSLSLNETFIDILKKTDASIQEESQEFQLPVQTKLRRLQFENGILIQKLMSTSKLSREDINWTVYNQYQLFKNQLLSNLS